MGTSLGAPPGLAPTPTCGPEEKPSPCSSTARSSVKPRPPATREQQMEREPREKPACMQPRLPPMEEQPATGLTRPLATEEPIPDRPCLPAAGDRRPGPPLLHNQPTSSQTRLSEERTPRGTPPDISRQGDCRGRPPRSSQDAGSATSSLRKGHNEARCREKNRGSKYTVHRNSCWVEVFFYYTAGHSSRRISCQTAASDRSLDHFLDRWENFRTVEGAAGPQTAGSESGVPG
uniref:Allograft inflammatory factor 1-like isoform X1 n=1 Tax=Geotrypetes seraphini TaxID=260995 RepID=A0A6P8SFR8_GEOSA|nr:allograft inflammatory factor 1-like isoform X1 [Geotrypetes seraphini]